MQPTNAPTNATTRPKEPDKTRVTETKKGNTTPKIVTTEAKMVTATKIVTTESKKATTEVKIVTTKARITTEAKNMATESKKVTTATEARKATTEANKATACARNAITKAYKTTDGEKKVTNEFNTEIPSKKKHWNDYEVVPLVKVLLTKDQGLRSKCHKEASKEMLKELKLKNAECWPKEL